MSGLDAEFLSKLLQEEATKPSRGGGGKRVDPTTQRDLQTWFKLQHHICANFCTHRIEGDNPTIPRDEEGNINGVGNSCWNPNCEDRTRNKENDRGTSIVLEVKGQFICRYCFLAGYLND